MRDKSPAGYRVSFINPTPTTIMLIVINQLRAYLRTTLEYPTFGRLFGRFGRRLVVVLGIYLVKEMMIF